MSFCSRSWDYFTLDKKKTKNDIKISVPQKSLHLEAFVLFLWYSVDDCKNTSMPSDDSFMWFMTQTKVYWLSPTGGFRAELQRPLPVRAGSAARWYAGETRRGARRTAAPWTHCSGPCTVAHGCSGPWTGIWPLLWVFSPLSWVPHFPSPNSHSPRARTEKKIHLMSSRSKKDWDKAHFLKNMYTVKDKSIKFTVKNN